MSGGRDLWENLWHAESATAGAEIRPPCAVGDGYFAVATVTPSHSSGGGSRRKASARAA